jgi:hypothetical protein
MQIISITLLLVSLLYAGISVVTNSRELSKAKVSQIIAVTLKAFSATS